MVIESTPTQTHATIILLDAEFTDSDAIKVNCESKTVPPLECHCKSKVKSSTAKPTPTICFAHALCDDAATNCDPVPSTGA